MQNKYLLYYIYYIFINCYSFKLSGLIYYCEHYTYIFLYTNTNQRRKTIN